MKNTHHNLTKGQFSALKSCLLFQGLTERQLYAIISHWHIKKFSAGAIVLLEGYAGDEVSMILEGAAKIFYCDNHGREMVIGYKGKGGVIGEMGFIDGAARSASVETIMPSTMVWTDRDSFRQCCRMAPRIYDNLLKIITLQLRVTNARIQILQASGASARVARLLIHLLQETDGPNIPFKLSQTDIGTMTNLSRATVNSVLSRWKQQKYISVDTRYHINIHDLAALEREAQ